eukprot:scaffold914_cov202-Prasinococcus_capsulatus_cf.AAC.1
MPCAVLRRDTIIGPVCRRQGVGINASSLSGRPSSAEVSSLNGDIRMRNMNSRTNTCHFSL